MTPRERMMTDYRYRMVCWAAIELYQSGWNIRELQVVTGLGRSTIRDLVSEEEAPPEPPPRHVLLGRYGRREQLT